MVDMFEDTVNYVNKSLQLYSHLFPLLPTSPTASAHTHPTTPGYTTIKTLLKKQRPQNWIGSDYRQILVMILALRWANWMQTLTLQLLIWCTLHTPLTQQRLDHSR